MQIFIEGNSLKIKGEEKIKQLFMLKKQVVQLQIKKRKYLMVDLRELLLCICF